MSSPTPLPPSLALTTVPPWRARIRASLLHLGLCILVAMAVAALVLLLWYPAPYHSLSGGLYLLAMVLAVDVVLGPVLTLLVYRNTKSLKELVLDFSLIALLQAGALAYGLWTVYSARPVHLVFEYHRLAVVHAAEIPEADLGQAPPAWQTLPKTGPTLLSLRALRAEEVVESTMLALAGQAQAAQPPLWQDYDLAHTKILVAAQPMPQLLERFPAARLLIEQAVAATGLPSPQLRSLPVIARQHTAWTALIDTHTARPVAWLPLDSF